MLKRTAIVVAFLIILGQLVSPAFAHHDGTQQIPPPDYSGWQKESPKVVDQGGTAYEFVVHRDGPMQSFSNIVVEFHKVADGKGAKEGFWWAQVTRDAKDAITTGNLFLYAYEPGVGKFNGYYLYMGGPAPAEQIKDFLEKLLK